MVACTYKVVVLDDQGKLLSQHETGAGVDNIDYLPSRHWLFAAAGKAAKLTIADVNDRGSLSGIAVVDTTPGARVVVAEANGNAYLADSANGRVLLLMQ
jgi:hypothetical protein